MPSPYTGQNDSVLTSSYGQVTLVGCLSSLKCGTQNQFEKPNKKRQTMNFGKSFFLLFVMHLGTITPGHGLVSREGLGAQRVVLLVWTDFSGSKVTSNIS